MILLFSRHVNEIISRTILRDVKMMIMIVLMIACGNDVEEEFDDDNMVVTKVDKRKSR
jgi:hypothetical protein